MPDYYLVHDRAVLEDQLRPALAEAWRRRSFLPCRDLVRTWGPVALAFADRYHLDPNDLVLPRLDELPFDRALWRAAIGELLQVAARESPDIPAHLDTIAHLLEGQPRGEPSPWERALHGTRDLTFGLTTYRPGYAGYNNVDDVAGLAGWFSGISCSAWTTADLAGMPDLEEEDREEELAFARAWFEVLVLLYARAARHDQVVVLESVF